MMTGNPPSIALLVPSNVCDPSNADQRNVAQNTLGVKSNPTACSVLFNEEAMKLESWVFLVVHTSLIPHTWSSAIPLKTLFVHLVPAVKEVLKNNSHLTRVRHSAGPQGIGKRQLHSRAISDAFRVRSNQKRITTSTDSKRRVLPNAGRRRNNRALLSSINLSDVGKLLNFCMELLESCYRLTVRKRCPKKLEDYAYEVPGFECSSKDERFIVLGRGRILLLKSGSTPCLTQKKPNKWSDSTFSFHLGLAKINRNRIKAIEGSVPNYTLARRAARIQRN